MTHPRVLVCAVALVFGVFSAVGYADDGSEDADDAPVAKAGHPHKGKHTADADHAGNQHPAGTPPTSCPGEGWMLSDGRCVKVEATPVVGPGR